MIFGRANATCARSVIVLGGNFTQPERLSALTQQLDPEGTFALKKPTRMEGALGGLNEIVNISTKVYLSLDPKGAFNSR